MKNIYYILIAVLLFSCNAGTVEINGTAKGMDGAAVSVLDLEGKTLYSSVIQSGKFSIKKQALPEVGYYTLSILSGPDTRDFEIYLEDASYTIDVPQKQSDYLKITTTSKTQNKISAYYNFENDLMAKHWQQVDFWKAKLNDPTIKDMPEAEFQNILDHVESNRNREHGLHVAVLDSFIKKQIHNDIVPHLITNMNYKSYPYAYYNLYKKLSPEVQDSEEGKKIGEELKVLAKKAEENVIIHKR
jgi:hypothetical protein